VVKLRLRSGGPEKPLGFVLPADAIIVGGEITKTIEIALVLFSLVVDRLGELLIVIVPEQSAFTA
jgi:hypothetical protein